MNLKEAFRFQNKMTVLMEEAQGILREDANVLRVVDTMLCSKVMPGAADVVEEHVHPSEFADNIYGVVRFAVYLMGEREKLSAAIRRAKDALPIDMDSEVSLNAKRQELVRSLTRMAELRNGEIYMSHGGVGYRFNEEGNQVNYRCAMTRVTTLNFDRKAVRILAAELSRKADAVSAELDQCLINFHVEYAAPFGVNDSFAEVFAGYAGL